MKHVKSAISVCLGLLLMSCHDHTYLAEGGITGSGISVGPITAFGSIWVGGVRYDTSSATFIRNGKTASNGQTDFTVGEIVDIAGYITPDGQGIATKVTFDRDLSGLVTARSTDGKTIQILGQTVETDALTLFSGFTSLSSLQIGNLVELSGTRTQDGSWIASTLKLMSKEFINGASELELEGRALNINRDAMTFKVGGLTVDYSASIRNGVDDLTLADAPYIEISSSQNLLNGELKAGMIELENEYPVFNAGSETTLDGRITDFSTATSFEINGQPAIISDTTKFSHGDNSDLGAGAHISITGLINADMILEASKITVRQSANPASNLILEAKVEVVDAQAKTLIASGDKVTVNNETIILDYTVNGAQSINFNDLRTSDAVRITGRKLADGEIIALRIDRNAPAIRNDSTTKGFIRPKLNGAVINTNEFFRNIKNDEQTVVVTGDSIDNDWRVKKRVKLLKD